MRQRADVVEVAERDALALAAHFVDGVLQVAARTAPAYDQQVALRVAAELLPGNVVGGFGHLGGAGRNHLLVVGRVVRNAPFDAVFFQTAHAVFQSGFAGERPAAGELLVAYVGHETRLGRLVDDGRADGGVVLHLRDAPGFGTVGDEPVGEQHHGGHVLHGRPASNAKWKQSLGDEAATTMTGHSPLRP